MALCVKCSPAVFGHEGNVARLLSKYEINEFNEINQTTIQTSAGFPSPARISNLARFADSKRLEVAKQLGRLLRLFRLENNWTQADVAALLDVVPVTVRRWELGLREHRGRQLLYQIELNGAYIDQGLVFPGPLGGLLDPSVLTRNFEKLVRKAGLANARLHDLRHFHATMMLQAGDTSGRDQAVEDLS